VLRLVTAMLRSLAREFHIAVVLLHHSPTGEIIPGDIGALRGAGSIGGAVRFGFTVCCMSEDNARDYGITTERRSYYLRIDRAKASYAPPVIEADWFEKVSHCDATGENVGALHPWTPPVTGHPSQQTVNAMLADIAKGKDGEPWSPKLDKHPRSVMRMFERHDITGAINGKLALDSLKQAGGPIRSSRKRAATDPRLAAYASTP
jgi:hypothetical protein